MDYQSLHRAEFPPAVADPDQQHLIYDCGICGSMHPWDFAGDCRDDSNRYSDAEDYAERNEVHFLQVHEMSWQDRQQADAS